MVITEERVCWNCGSAWRSAAAHEALDAGGSCLLCGFALDHWQFRQEAVLVFEGPDLRLARWNEASERLTRRLIGQLAGHPAREIFAGADELVAAFDLVERRPGNLFMRVLHTMRTTGETVDLNLHVRSHIAGLVAVGALPVRDAEPPR